MTRTLASSFFSIYTAPAQVLLYIVYNEQARIGLIGLTAPKDSDSNPPEYWDRAALWNGM